MSDVTLSCQLQGLGRAEGAPRGPEQFQPSLRIGPMQPSDIEAVASLVSEAMNAEEGQQAENTLRLHFLSVEHGIDDGRKYVVARRDERLVGVAGLHHYVWGPRENVWLAWFAVNPGLVNQGLGGRLLDIVERTAQDLRYTTMFVETYSTTEFTNARRFYTRRGFELAGKVDQYLPGGGDMLIYRKDLRNAV